MQHGILYFVEIRGKESELEQPTDDCISKDHYSEEQIIQSIIYDQATESKCSPEMRKELSKKFTTSDFAKHMPTFRRLQRKLQRIEKLYPELYYRNQNVIEMFANSEAAIHVHSNIVEYDSDDTDLVWI